MTFKNKIREVETAHQKIETAPEAAKARYEVTLKELRHGYDQLRHQVEEVSRRVDQGVRRHPYETAAITVGVGFLAGFLLGLTVRPYSDDPDPLDGEDFSGLDRL